MEERDIPENKKSRFNILVWRTRSKREIEGNGERRKTRKQWNNENTKDDRERTGKCSQ